MSTEIEISKESTDKAKDILKFQKPRWDTTLAGFAKMIPQIFEGFYKVGAVTVNPNWVEAEIDGEKVQWPPMGKGRFAEILVEIPYKDQGYDELASLHDLLEGTMQSPMLYNRGWATHTIYDDKEPRAIIRMQIFDTLDSQLALFNDWASIDVLVKELQDKMRSHLAGMYLLNQTIQFKRMERSFVRANPGVVINPFQG